MPHGPSAITVVGTLLVLCVCLMDAGVTGAGDRKVLRPRVPPAQLAAARKLHNPLPATPALIEQGKTLYHGKAFCAACHGGDGKGLGPGVNPKLAKGALPRDFTDRAWQAARTDGELMWILQHGSPGTAMASFIPLVISEEEGWQLILYMRSLGGSP